MRILVSGSNGLIGRACVDYLKGQGHDIVRLVRSKRELAQGSSIYWDPTRGELRKEDFEDFDAVLHLAGRKITSKRWSKKFKSSIFLSRCRDTWLLSEVLLRLHRPPKTFITASAVGFYGDRGEETLTEESSQGAGFLADLASRWESASAAIENRGVRVVRVRFGVVLSPKGGVLASMIPLYRMGLGAVLGSGKQYMSWIGLDDLLKAIRHCLLHEEIEGPVNVVAPFPVTQEEFSSLLAKHLKRKVFFRIPGSILRLLMGEMADELLLASTKVYPRKLLESGYTFFTPRLDLYLLSESL